MSNSERENSVDLQQVLNIVHKTDPGKTRTRNEDAVTVNSALGLVILADGMGGHNAGEVASGMATTLLATEFEKVLVDQPLSAMRGEQARAIAHDTLRQLIAEANAAIFRAAESQPQYKGMGTTLVVALFYDNQVTVAHIGDSRLYRLREGQLEQLTKDHSLLQEWIDSGMITPEQALTAQHKNLVTRALGVDAQVEPEIHDYPVMPGDLFLLCSDGLYDMVPDEETAMTLQMLGANLELAANQLIDQANDAGGKDNVTVALVGVKEPFSAPSGWWQRFLVWLK
jgi:PPM family protein phosphatase